MSQFEKIPDLQKIFTKHKISDAAQKELQDAFEKMIVKTFYREVGKAKPKTKEKVENTADICPGIFYKGTAKEKPCTFKITNNGFCGRHDPDKAKPAPKTKVEKATGNSCNFIIKKTGNHCQNSGTVKPDNADFHYCKRHSTKWESVENVTKLSDDENASDENASDENASDENASDE